MAILKRGRFQGVGFSRGVEDHVIEFTPPPFWSPPSLIPFTVREKVEIFNTLSDKKINRVGKRGVRLGYIAVAHWLEGL